MRKLLDQTFKTRMQWPFYQHTVAQNVAIKLVVTLGRFDLRHDLPSVLWHCWLGGRKGIRSVKTEWWVLEWLSVWSKVQTCIWPSWCNCHSLSLASVKSRLVLPLWYRLIWVVPYKGPLNGCVWSQTWTRTHRERKCANTICTVPVPWAGHFQS